MTRKYLKRNSSKSQIKPISKSAKVSYPTKQDDELVLFNLPVLPLILNYLNQKDKIELSSVNKSLRLKLEPLIFRKIKLFPNNYRNNHNQNGRKINIRSIQSILLDQVIEFIGPKNHLVKEVIIREDFNNKFAIKFFSKFCYITNLNFRNTFKKPIIIDIIKPLNSLEHLHFDRCLFPNYSNPNDSNIEFQLPKSIKTFICEDYHGWYTYLDPLQKIDETYTNLRSITLTNPEIFNQFKNHHPSLVELDISHHTLSDIPLIEEILANNPQITKLSLPGTQFTESLMSSILSLKNLTSLIFTRWSVYQDYSNWALVDNWTITTIQINHHLSFEIRSLLLHACKNLKTIQFVSGSLEADKILWHNYHGSLKSIEFNHFTNIPHSFYYYINCLSLEKIILKNQDENGWKDDLLKKLNELKCWKVTTRETIILTRLRDDRSNGYFVL